jgi:plasmid stabilization system protein ParE
VARESGQAPTAFDDDLARLVENLEEHADTLGLPARDGSGLRRVFLERIRYYVYFRIGAEAGAVDILALWHASRGRQPRIR